VVDAATQKDFDSCGAGRLLSSATYTRAVAVRVLEEISTSVLFGPHGNKVTDLLRVAVELEARDVDILASHFDLTANEAYSRSWNKWLDENDNNSVHLGYNHPHTLQMGVAGKRGPINGGFSLVHRLVFNRAKTVAGDCVFDTDEDDSIFLVGPWSDASSALLCAGMALGAPECVAKADMPLLLKAWMALSEYRRKNA
jgi:hypothetical protein